MPGEKVILIRYIGVQIMNTISTRPKGGERLPLPICVGCAREMRPAKNRVIVEYVAPDNQSIEIRCGDRYRCTTCEYTVIAEIALTPLANQSQFGYRKVLANYPERIKVFV